MTSLNFILARKILKTKAKKQNGFTLIELMVVVAILGVLTAVGLPELSKAQEKSKDAAAIATLTNAAKECSLSLILNGNGNDYTAANFTAGAATVDGNCAMTSSTTSGVTTITGPILTLLSETGTTFTNTFNGNTPGVSS